MRRFAESIILLWGWQRWLAAMLAGAVTALAMPPVGFFPVIFITLPVLVWLLDGIGEGGHASMSVVLRTAFFTGWCFGFGYFVAGLYWLGEAFLVERDKFFWLLPLGVAGLPAVLAVFMGLGTLAAQLLWSRNIWRIVSLTFGLVLGEWLRATILTGFPWNNLGYALAGLEIQMQLGALVGLHGLTALAVFCGAAPAVLADPPGHRKPLLVPLIALGLLVAQGIYGGVRLLLASDANVANTRIRIVQPNLTQTDRLDPVRRLGVVDRLISVTQSNHGEGSRGVEDFTHIIWPESTFPFLITSQPMVLSRIDAMLPSGATLIVGAARAEDGGAGSRSARIYNSLYVFDDQARIIDRYDKNHLVPFGEYLPLHDWLQEAGLFPFSGFGSFSAGRQRHPIATPKAPPFMPLICYEIIFPGEVVPAGAERPRWLVNLSDDSWFGDTPGPRQHLLQARLRAVEEGLPVARSTTTGISAMIDAHGRILGSVAVGAEGVVDTALPVALDRTVYSRISATFPVAMLGMLLLSALLGQGLAQKRHRL